MMVGLPDFREERVENRTKSGKMPKFPMALKWNSRSYRLSLNGKNIDPPFHHPVPKYLP